MAGPGEEKHGPGAGGSGLALLPSSFLHLLPDVRDGGPVLYFAALFYCCVQCIGARIRNNLPRQTDRICHDLYQTDQIDHDPDHLRVPNILSAVRGCAASAKYRSDPGNMS